MKIGLYFGSFNPIHIGHLVIANYMVEFTALDEVWLVVSPHNPHKKKCTLLNEYHRLEMVQLAAKEYNKIHASNVEFSMPQPSYTVDTLAYISEKYPQHTFCLIMGADNLRTLHNWKSYETILKKYEIYAYPRLESNGEKIISHPSIHIIKDVPIMQISSSFIRESIKEGKKIAALLHPKVWELIEKRHFYR